MKKILAFFAIIVLSFNLSFIQPVKADTFSIPFSAVPDLINAFYTIAAGGKIEFSALIGDITGIDDFWQNLHDYYDTNYTQPLLQSTQGLVDIGLSGLALNGVDNINVNDNLSIPITPQDIANFMGYDVNWTDRYKNPDSIIVNPDSTYAAQLNRINLRDSSDATCFWFYNYPSQYVIDSSNTITLLAYPPTSYSWVSYNGNVFPTSISNYTTNTCIACYPITININFNNGIYSYSTTAESIPRAVTNTYNGTWNLVQLIINNGNYTINGNGNNSLYTVTWSYSNSDLGLVLNHIAEHFKNVNIYVDGELWSYIGDVPSSGISLNDYTQVGNTDNITYGVFPLTSTGDIGLDLAKWGEYIYNKCISGDGTLTMDTVIDDGWDLVDTEDGERAITQDDEEDVAKVIHGFVGTTATTPTPTPDIGDPPVLKIIPPILELPDEIWPDGGRDTTVLAQIIHATDVAIPNDIMTIFWSIIGILVIGGLISILHK